MVRLQEDFGYILRHHCAAHRCQLAANEFAAVPQINQLINVRTSTRVCFVLPGPVQLLNGRWAMKSSHNDASMIWNTPEFTLTVLSLGNSLLQKAQPPDLNFAMQLINNIVTFIDNAHTRRKLLQQYCKDNGETYQTLKHQSQTRWLSS